MLCSYLLANSLLTKHATTVSSALSRSMPNLAYPTCYGFFITYTYTSLTLIYTETYLCRKFPISFLLFLMIFIYGTVYLLLVPPISHVQIDYERSKGKVFVFFLGI